MGPIFDHREAEVRLFRWPRTGCKISVSDGVVGHAVCRGWGSAHTDVCTHIGEGGGRDRFSTIEKRRCDYACGRAQAGRVSARDGAPAQAVCPSEIRCAPALQLAPVACTHECNSHLSTFMRSETVRDSSSRRTVSMDSLGGLPVNVEHVPHAVCIHAPDRARPPRATNLDPWH